MCAVLQVYNLSAGKSLPQWLAEAQKKKQSLGCIVIVAMWLWLDKHKHIITSGRLQVWTHLWISFLHVSANLSKDIEGICRCSIEPWNHQICCWGRFGAMRTGCHNFATIIYRINIDQHLAVRQPQISGFQEAHRLDSGRKWGDRKTFKAMKEVLYSVSDCFGRYSKPTSWAASLHYNNCTLVRRCAFLPRMQSD